MARYIDVEGYRKLLDEEYKKTRELIYQGETHLDNIAEGFSEASRVIDRMPTADVVPKSEVEKWKEINEQLHKEMSERIIEERKIERKLVAREIFEEIEMLLKVGYIPYTTPDGKIATLKSKWWSIAPEDLAELKRKYTEEK